MERFNASSLAAAASPGGGRRRAGGGSGRASRALAIAAALTLVALASTPAHAQRVTGAVHGRVLRGGEPQAEASITATSLTTGAVVAAASRSNGAYALPGLPPGQYLVAVTLAGGEEAVEYVDVGIGQTLQLDLDVAATGVQGSETIEVSARRAETRTSEVATNVDREQIRNLPQNQRNFLNFAALAPGVRVSDDEFRKETSSGGLGASQTNVFIDGVSLKNNIIQGGVAGQDASRGSPFPQLAVGGFRVLTQNFKAEYEQAGTSIISAITRSGGNELHGDFYVSYQDRQMVTIDPFAEARNERKPTYGRYQLGGLLSGPIVKQRVFGLITYEGNYQDRANQVVIGNPTPENLERFRRYQGSFTSPFREHLAFSKVTWLPGADQTVDLSTSLRTESDIRSFGGQTSRENAEDVRNNVFTTALRHQWRRQSGLVNEATAQFLYSQFNPGALNPDLIGQEYVGVIKIGGRDTDQDIVQRTITLRDDVTLPSFEAAGDHRVKVGAKLAFQHYQVERTQFGNPLFKFRIDPANNLDFEIPFEAQFGVGDPRVTSSNNQLGLYAQDDWALSPRLELNLGIRWDLETNPLNNDYVTPADVRAAVTELAADVAEENGPDFFRVENYLTDGTQRPIFFGAIQPRIGGSYDVFGNQRTVVFGGAGRYYDRTLFNTGVDERLRLQYGVRTFRFSRDGQPRDGQPTIVWDPAYLSRAGLQGLIDQGVAPRPEIFLLENDTRPLHTDQLSAGVRQAVGPFNVALTFSHIRGEDGVGFYPANRSIHEDRPFLPVPGEFGNVLISADDIQSRFTGFFVTAEKLYTEASRWGVSLAYTLGWSRIRGGDFNFDFPSIEATPMTPGDADERQRLVVAAIVGLPHAYKLSTLITLGTGLPYNIADASAGFGADFRFRRNAGRAEDFLEYKQVDLRLAQDLKLSGQHRMTWFIEAFNLFNSENLGGYDGFIPPEGENPNPNFGQPSRLVGPTRSFQVGLTYGF